jgi:predicted RNase H-like HicB family nuclease
MYKIEIVPEQDGSGFNASIPALKGCMAFGETVESALETLADVKQTWMELAKEHGWEIPKPGVLDSLIHYDPESDSLHLAMSREPSIVHYTDHPYVAHLVNHKGYSIGFHIEAVSKFIEAGITKSDRSSIHIGKVPQIRGRS